MTEEQSPDETERAGEWGLDWSIPVEAGATAQFESGDLLWESDFQPETLVKIVEVANGRVPLNVTVNDRDTELVAIAGLSPEEARRLAQALTECADIAEGQL